MLRSKAIREKFISHSASLNAEGFFSRKNGKELQEIFNHIVGTLPYTPEETISLTDLENELLKKGIQTNNLFFILKLLESVDSIRVGTDAIRLHPLMMP